MVYADSIITRNENETFDKCTPIAYFALPEHDRLVLLHGSYVGPQPMWRKSLHEELGYFNESLKVAGDYEWWLRISEKYSLKHIPELLGLYLLSPQSLEHTNEKLSSLEAIMIQEYYKERAKNTFDLSEFNSNKYSKYKKGFVVREYQPFDKPLIKVFCDRLHI